MDEKLEDIQNRINTFKIFCDLIENSMRQIEVDLELQTRGDYSHFKKNLLENWVRSCISHLSSKYNEAEDLINSIIKERFRYIKDLSESSLSFNSKLSILMNYFNLSNEDIAKTLGVTTSTIVNWLDGSIEPNEHMQPLIIQSIYKTCFKIINKK